MSEFWSSFTPPESWYNPDCISIEAGNISIENYGRLENLVGERLTLDEFNWWVRRGADFLDSSMIGKMVVSVGGCTSPSLPPAGCRQWLKQKGLPANDENVIRWAKQIEQGSDSIGWYSILLVSVFLVLCILAAILTQWVISITKFI